MEGQATPSPAGITSPTNYQASLSEPAQNHILGPFQYVPHAGNGNATTPWRYSSGYNTPHPTAGTSNSPASEPATPNSSLDRIPPAPPAAAPRVIHRVMTRKERKRVVAVALKGMKRDKLYLHTLSDDKFRILVGLPSRLPGHSDKQFSKRCCHLYRCKMQPGRVFLDQRWRYLRSAKLAKFNPRPRPPISPLRQELVDDDDDREPLYQERWDTDVVLSDTWAADDLSAWDVENFYTPNVPHMEEPITPAFEEPTAPAFKEPTTPTMQEPDALVKIGLEGLSTSAVANDLGLGYLHYDNLPLEAMTGLVDSMEPTCDGRGRTSRGSQGQLEVLGQAVWTAWAGAELSHQEVIAEMVASAGSSKALDNDAVPVKAFEETPTDELEANPSGPESARTEKRKRIGELNCETHKKRRIDRSSWAGEHLPCLMAPLKPVKRKATDGPDERLPKRMCPAPNLESPANARSNTRTSALSFSQLDGAFDDLPYCLESALPSRPNPALGPNSLTWPNSIPTPHNRIGSSEQPPSSLIGVPQIVVTGDTDMDDDSYEDGEVRRYGAGESYRPFNNRDRDRSPRGGRSPPRERARTPPGGSDSYVPGRSPRRRSRSPDRYRYRERSRERDGGDVWRRRDRSRSRARSPARRSSPPRRSPPRRSPRRYPSPKRDDRADRARSPRRDYDSRDSRRRSRSPYDRDWTSQRNQSPARRSTPAAFRGGSYRPRSRSPDRRDDRYGGSSYRRPSPPRDSLDSSGGMTSRSASRVSSPRPSSNRGRDDRSRPHSPTRSPNPATTGAAAPLPVREPPRQPAHDAVSSTPTRSPPRGPAAQRQSLSGASAARNAAAPVASPNLPATRHQPPAGPSPRANTTSPTMPPTGPRGYVPPRGGGFTPRGGGRGAWPPGPGRHMPGPSVSPTIPPTGPSNIPTGPRAAPSSASGQSPSLASKPFNPPTGPASLHSGAPRPTLAQNLMANMPPIIPGGKLDPSLTPLSTGVIKELEPHHRKLKEEEERMREEIKVRQERLRKSLRVWDKLERESKSFELKSDLSEKSLKNLAGEGLGGAAF